MVELEHRYMVVQLRTGAVELIGGGCMCIECLMEAQLPVVLSARRCC